MTPDPPAESPGTAGELYPPGRSPFRTGPPATPLQRAIPVSTDLKEYRPATLRRDLVAGVTVAALAMPASMAFAELAGLPAVTGLYTLLLPTIAYVLLASSKRLMIGPEGATAAMAGAAIAPIVATSPEHATDAAAVLALLVGAIFFVARLLRLGWLVDYFSRPVLVGYIHGVAIVLLIDQLAKLTGTSISAEQPLSQVVELVREVSSISATTAAVGGVSLAVLFVLRWRPPRAPAALLVVVVAIAASAGLALAEHGVATLGPIPSGLPSLHRPDLGGVGGLQHLLGPAVGIFAVSFADSALTARAYAGKHQEHVRVGQELCALGLASIAAGATRGFPISASGSRTAVADGMGSRTQIAAIFATITVALVLLFLTGPMSYLPSAVLGAVIFFAAAGLLDPAAWRSLANGDRRELVIAAVTAIGVMSVGILPALLVAVALSILDAVARSSRPHDAVLGEVERLGRWADVRFHPSARIAPGVVVYRLDDRLFFANADYVKGRIREALAGAPGDVLWVVFDAESVVTIDDTGLEALRAIVRDLEASGIHLAIARAHGRIERLLDESGLTTVIGAARIYPTVSAAVADLAPGRSTNGSA